MSSLRVTSLKGRTGSQSPTLPDGAVVTGVATATSFSGSGIGLTSIPAAELTGTLPAISGENLTNLPASGDANDITASLFT
jgi:hypothetical protein|tara:strand:+ start:270 stop:512 length:243 start_codon:yes stop_codon:yes gene_type:complete